MSPRDSEKDFLTTELTIVFYADHAECILCEDGLNVVSPKHEISFLGVVCGSLQVGVQRSTACSWQ